MTNLNLQRITFIAAAGLVLLAIPSCSDNGGDEGCVNGATQGCACPDGSTASQTCTGGAWGECLCNAGCQNGATQACTCTDGTSGSQTCENDAWTTCVCQSGCSDGDTQTCTCTDGTTGSQTCEGGSFGECTCASCVGDFILAFSSWQGEGFFVACQGGPPATNCKDGYSIIFDDTGECICMPACESLGMSEGDDCSTDGTMHCAFIQNNSGESSGVFCAPDSWNLCGR